jgi:hypothetical protein
MITCANSLYRERDAQSQFPGHQPRRDLRWIADPHFALRRPAISWSSWPICCLRNRTCSTPINSRVEDWRQVAVDSADLGLPVSSGSASLAASDAGLQPPPHQTQRADFLHWAFLCVSHQGLCGRFVLEGFQLMARATRYSVNSPSVL